MKGDQAVRGHVAGAVCAGGGMQLGTEVGGGLSWSGREECCLDGCSCPLVPGKDAENRTKHTGWGKIQGTPQAEG